MLELKNISKNYQDFKLNEISLKVKDGEYFVILGESGAGKTLVLEIIAGLIEPDNGNVFYNGNDITNQKIQKRNIGLVFQDFAVFPHMNVKKNIAYAIRSKNNKSDVNNKVYELAKKIEISHLLDRKPNTLSGGELQRVALARTLALEPNFLLLDEPLSSLDVQLRSELRSLLKKINKEGISIIHVTHDYEEALALANKIGIINNGEIVQIGTPKDVFHNPSSKFVANFTGIKNFYNIKSISENRILLEDKVEITVSPDINNYKYAMFRAEDVVLSNAEIISSLTNNLKGRIIEIIPTINGIDIIVDVGIKVVAKITSESCEKMDLSEGKEIWVSFKASAIKRI